MGWRDVRYLVLFGGSESFLSRPKVGRIFCCFKSDEKLKWCDDWAAMRGETSLM